MGRGRPTGTAGYCSKLPDIATLKKLSNGMPSGVSGHITVDTFDEIESCDVMTIHFGSEVKVQQDKTIFVALYLQWACHDMSLVEWNWNMVKCPQQEGTWECGYYVVIAMFELFFQKQSNFSDNVWNDIKPRTMRDIDLG
ncbi:ulp1 protease family, C-terminal catalytic domain-containing protein [Tanacetum coccineum]